MSFEAQHIPYPPADSPLLNSAEALEGAVAGEGPDAAVAGHYGHPFQEQRALATGTALVDLSHRGVVTVSGTDRLTWLNVLTSQALDQLAPGHSTEALFLDLRGRIEFLVKVIDDGATTWLIVEPGLNASLAAWLDAMRFASRVEIADRTGEIAVLGATAAIPGLEETVVWQDPWPQISEGGYPYTIDPDPAQHVGAEWSWYEYLVSHEQLIELAKNPPEGWRWAGTLSSEALRIEAGRPRQNLDSDERSIPHELDLLRTAVHLTKGCYKGQETVARVHNLGHPPRRLVQLEIDGSVHGKPAVGAEVILRPEGAIHRDDAELASARSLGTVTSVGIHYEGGPLALAIIRRNTDPEAALLIREKDADGNVTEYWDAVQVPLVSPTAGNTVGRPPLANLRRR